jgi:hypothetical protein
MAAMISALDGFTSIPPVRNGEKGHMELDWSDDLQEKIVQFDFQCVRTDVLGIASLSTILDGLLSQLSVKQSDEQKEHKRKELLTILYKMIGKTRDIEGGKGEYMISYMMIDVWHRFFPRLATVALSLFVFPPTNLSRVFWLEDIGLQDPKDQIPYGSWKDIKYFCDYVKKLGASSNHELIRSCILFINSQIRFDEEAFHKKQPISLAGKWVPRESSDKFGWLFEPLATNYFDAYIRSAKTAESKGRAIKKCKAQYRALSTRLNQYLDTVQIKQSAKNWAFIDHSKTTSITMVKQRKAFFNQTKKGGQQRSHESDRVQCAENLRSYLETLKREGKEVKGKNVGLEMFAAQALDMFNDKNNSSLNQEEVDILNSQWRDNGNKKNANGLGSIIPIVDTSGSMYGDPLCAAIALGCRVAEKSILGKRVMTFSAEPEWINLDGCETFTDMVETIMTKSDTAGLNTDFYKALNLILTVIEECRIPPADVENMILAIFSDMQIDDNLYVMVNGGNSYMSTDAQKTAARGKWATMFQDIKQKYAETGMRLYGQPLNPPHILFWNLRKTDGFPALSTEANCSMMSGFDPTILNIFCELGIQALKEFTPYKMLMKQLENERYDIMEQLICAASV